VILNHCPVEMAEQVKLQARQQAKSKLLYKCLAGRITASNMKVVWCIVEQ